MIDLPALLSRIRDRRLAASRAHSLLVGLSGIDGSGKGFLAARIAAELEGDGVRVALLNVDGWLNLPAVRFSHTDPAERFYRHALRLDPMFRQLVLPLRRNRSHRLVAQYVEETATGYRPHVYQFQDADVILLEGIFIYKRAYRPHFDLAFWIDCTFETALERALQRGQEGLPPEETVAAYQTIYFPAQRLHFERDEPRNLADGIIANDPRLAPSNAEPVSRAPSRCAGATDSCD